MDKPDLLDPEYVEVELRLGKDLTQKIFGMKKDELIEKLIVTILKSHVQEETIEESEVTIRKLEQISLNTERDYKKLKSITSGIVDKL